MPKIPFLILNSIRIMFISTSPDEFQTYLYHLRFLLEIEFTVLLWKKKI